MKIEKCTVALIAIIICLMFYLKTLYDYEYIVRVSKDIPYLERSVDMKDSILRDYMESKINRVAQSQDEYKYSTSKRIDILEKKIKRLEK